MADDCREAAEKLAREWDKLDKPTRAIIDDADKFRHEGNIAQAAESYNRAINLLSSEDAHARAAARAGLGICCLLQEEMEKATLTKAKDNLASALKIFRGHDSRIEGVILLLLGVAYQAQGTQESLEEALKISMQAEKALEGEELEKIARQRVHELNSLLLTKREPAAPGAKPEPTPTELMPEYPTPNWARIPILGEIGAGPLLLSPDNVEGHIPIGPERARDIDFALHVKGNSMAGAGIKDGDIVYIHSQSHADNGSIVVAMVADEMPGFALKRYHFDGQRIHLWSEPEKGQGEEYLTVDKQDARKVQIVGRVIMP